MVDVQLEKGYTRIANKILEQMATVKLSPTQYRIIFLIWRYTYGFKRKEHDMSLSFIGNATGIDKRNIQRELKSLEDRRIIKQSVKHGSYRRIAFNKNFDEWDTPLTIGETDNTKKSTVGESDNTTVGETNNTTVGETNNKERKNLKKNLKKKDDDMNNPFRVYEMHFGFPSQILIQEFNYWIDESQFKEPEAIICEVIKRAKLQLPRNPAKYVTKILEDLHRMELYTLEAVQKYNEKFDNKVKVTTKKHKKHNEIDWENL